MTIPAWKKFSLQEGRMVNAKMLTDDLSLLILEAPKNEIKETLHKIRIDESFEMNVKNLLQVDVNRLKLTSEFLGQDPLGIIREGLVYLILLVIYSKLSYRCNSCKNVVKRDITTKDRKVCISCNMDMCKSCYNGCGKGFTCEPCISWITEKITLPI